MNFTYKFTRNSLLVAALLASFASCQKMDKPGVGDFPKDTNPVGGPLKFFTAFDNTNVDSIRANFGTNTDVTYAPGINGAGYHGSPTAFVQYGKANDFSSATSFTISFWLKKTPQAAGSGTNFAFGLNTSRDIWTKLELFLEFEDAGNPSTVDSAAAKLYIQDQWFEFVGVKRMPKVLNGQWHHLAFTYDENSSKLYTYIDGVAYLNTEPSVTDVKNGGSPRGKLSFNSVNGFTIGGPSAASHSANSWMGNFDGDLDQFRLYGKALTAAEVAALYASKL